MREEFKIYEMSLFIEEGELENSLKSSIHIQQIPGRYSYGEDMSNFVKAKSNKDELIPIVYPIRPFIEDYDEQLIATVYEKGIPSSKQCSLLNEKLVSSLISYLTDKIDINTPKCIEIIKYLKLLKLDVKYEI